MCSRCVNLPARVFCSHCGSVNLRIDPDFNDFEWLQSDEEQQQKKQNSDRILKFLQDEMDKMDETQKMFGDGI